MNLAPNRELVIFNAALLLPAAQRPSYLDLACAGEGELRRKVESLLEAHEAAGAFLTPVVPTEAFAAAAPAPAPAAPTIQITGSAAEKPGERIGRYKMLQEIGEGGCGAVYMAEQEEPVRRRVALKVIKLGMDTRAVIARFEAERQALALMDHPNIAKVLDAGATETGRPFFVMELVRGIKVTDYCDQNKLPTRERLQLFVQICHAIQHAHQKGVIHRDIKPSNILVTLHDGMPVPKVIDFGIAKATTDQRLTDKTMFTRFEQFIGTPAYMSPEQAEMSGLDVDTRTDIYSLGVLLYELLTGRTPFDADELQAAGIEAIRRTIREKEPLRPSTRVGAMKGEELTTTASRRGLEAPKLLSSLRGDLDWIVMKCLEKDRTRRYETANGLALDIGRHLANEPVAARPPGNLYRLRKSIQRNRLAFAGAGAVLIALLLGITGSSLQAIRASRAEAATRREKDLATRARQQAEAINRFLTEDVLIQATPDENAQDKNVTMREALEEATRRLDRNAEIRSQPEVEATLRLAIGVTWRRLGQLGAERHLQKAVDLRREKLGPDDLQTLAAQNELAKFFVQDARKYEAAEILSRQTWEARKRILGGDHRDTLRSLQAYVSALANQKKLKEAEPLARECLEMRKRTLGDDPETFESFGDLGYMLGTAGKFAEAERNEREELAGYERRGLTNTTSALYGMNDLAMYRFLQGYTEDAEKLLRDAHPRAFRFSGSNALVTLHIQHCLARVLAEKGSLEEAEELARKTLEIRETATPTHEGTGRTRLILAGVLIRKADRGKESTSYLDDAEGHLQKARSLFQERYSMKPELAAQAENWLGAIAVVRRDFDKAEALLLDRPQLLLAPTAAMSRGERCMAIEHIIGLYEAWGKADKEATWRKTLEELRAS